MHLFNTNKKVSTTEFRIYVFSFIVISLMLIPSVSAIKTYLVHKGYVAQHQTAKEKLLGLSKQLVQSPINYLSADRSLPMIKVDVKYDDWMKLEADRTAALQNGSIAEVRSQVGATLYHEGKKFKTRVRLQGDMLDHINGPKSWSLRFQIKSKAALFSSRRFSLVSPHVRIHQGPHLFSKTLEIANFDIVSPKHIPVKVVVNGTDWGVMLFEQAFSQSLLAVNNRTEGLIARLDLYDESVDEAGLRHRILKPRVIQGSTIFENSALRKQRLLALQLLNDFLDEKRTASDVFDARKLGEYLATVDIWGAWHALTWNNWRWYYNPHIAKLEPIQSDVAVSSAKHNWVMQSPSQSLAISKRMLTDPVVKQHYDSALAKLNTLISSGTLIEKLTKEEETYLKLIHSTSPLIARFDYSHLYSQTQCLIRGYQNHPCKGVPTIRPDLHLNMDKFSAHQNWDLASSFSSINKKNIFNITNNDKEPLNIRGITGTSDFGETATLADINAALPEFLEPNTAINIQIPNHIKSIELRAALESKKFASYEFIKDIQANSFMPRPVELKKSNINKLPFIEKQKNRWRIKPGKWYLDEQIITPANWQLELAAGAHLVIAPEAGIMVFGELLVKGTEDFPVRLESTSEHRGWGGLVVIGSPKKNNSRIEHLYVTRADSPKLGLWQPRGASLFINTHLKVNALTISKNTSEDALNIINSEIDLSRLTIKHALSDAFDCDFCRGSVKNSYFYDIGYRSGGDGIDVSGSKLFVENTKFHRVRDKAISGGENSRLTVKDIELSEVNFGIVAKDATKIQASRIEAELVKHNVLMSYCKKPIFGPAKLEVNDFFCADPECGKKYVSETDSLLTVNKVNVEQVNLDVKQLYSTVMKSDKPI